MLQFFVLETKGGHSVWRRIILCIYVSKRKSRTFFIDKSGKFNRFCLINGLTQLAIQDILSFHKYHNS